MPETKATVEAPTYSEFLNSLELLGVSLTDCKCRVDRSKLSLSKDSVSITVESKQELKHIEKDHFQIEAKIFVTGVTSGSKRSLLTISASFLLDLQSKTSANTDFLKRFAHSQSRLLVWPYFREFVSSMCGRMHIPPIVLPLNVKE
jgi:preprotein translocase subunit SecB